MQHHAPLYIICNSHFQILSIYANIHIFLFDADADTDADADADAEAVTLSSNNMSYTAYRRPLELDGHFYIDRAAASPT